MDEQNVNLLFVVDKIIEKLEARAGVIDLDLDDELVNEIRLEMAETIRENYAAAALSQPSAQGDSSHPAGGECGGVPQTLTDAEIIEIRKTCYGGRFGFPETAPWADSIKFARAILAAKKAAP